MEKSLKQPRIKICGITRPEEAEYLNEYGADYAGLVFYEKSRRNVSFADAERILKHLDQKILKTAVVVSPSEDFVKEIEQLGFDILQVHGNLTPEIRKTTGIPIWYAVNITSKDALYAFFQKEEELGTDKILGYAADGAGYGGGKPFDWDGLSKSVREFTKGKQLILAGGLTEDNVRQGIRFFEPDVVDVSSGVEEDGKKSREKIERFIRKVRKDER